MVAEPGWGEGHEGDSRRAPAGASERGLVALWAALLALTALTIFVSRLDIGHWRAVCAITIASTKAALVVAIYMRLKDEDRAFKYMFCAALFTMAVILGLTFVDVAFR